jgi:hypothetical protein
MPCYLLGLMSGFFNSFNQQVAARSTWEWYNCIGQNSNAKIACFYRQGEYA